MICSRDFQAMLDARLGPGTVRRAFDELGLLARWMLSDEALEVAAQQRPPDGERQRCRPRPSGGPGTFCIIFALPSLAQHALIRRGFLFPLQWRSERDDSPRLPQSIRQLANTVRDVLGRPRYGLGYPDPQDDWPDLSGLDSQVLSAESGFAPAAAALHLLAAGGSPDPAVLATGAWRTREGLVRVGDIDLKTAAAAAHGAQSLYVPAGCVPNPPPGGPPKVLPLKSGLVEGRLDPLEALTDLLVDMDVEPPGEGRPALVAFHQRMARAPRRRTDFYVRRLLPLIATDCHERLQAVLQPLPTHLVAFLGPNWETNAIALRATKAGTCLLFHEDKPDIVQAERDFCDYAEHLGAGVATECLPAQPRLDDPQQIHWIADRLEHRLRGVDRSRVAFDVTPGTKPMTLLLALAAWPESWLLYLSQGFDGRERTPGQESYMACRVGQLRSTPTTAVSP